MNLNLDALYSFAVFAESMNFTHAAERLFLSQPALHVKIRKLSEELGTSLYFKSGRKLELTEDGKRVAQFARETDQSVQEFVESISRSGVHQPVSLAAGRGCYLYLLDKAIGNFRKKSESPLRLMTADRDATIEKVQNGLAHFGVTALSTLPADLDVKKILDVPAMLIVPQEDPLAVRKSISVKGIKNRDLIVPSEGRPHREMIARILKMNGVPWQIAVEADGWELAIEFVKLGMGAAIVNGCCKLPKNVRGVPIKDFPGTSYYLLSRKKFKMTQDQELLFRLIASHVSAP